MDITMFLSSFFSLQEKEAGNKKRKDSNVDTIIQGIFTLYRYTINIPCVVDNIKYIMTRWAKYRKRYRINSAMLSICQAKKSPRTFLA
jgi:hypothetical protein